MDEIKVSDLKKVADFSLVPDNQLQWLLDQGKILHLEVGDLLFNAGDAIDQFFFIQSGTLRLCLNQGGKQKEMREIYASQVTGYLPYSRATFAIAFCEAITPCLVFRCQAEKINAGISKNYELTAALVHMMLSRVREVTSIEQQNEKMFALGKLSAGLAHELNNPAAAIARAAALLQGQIKQLPHLFHEVSTLNIKDEKIDKIQNLITTKIENIPPTLSMLKRAALEDDISDWLYANKIEDLDTEGLTESGFDLENLDTIKACSTPQELPVVLQWISNFLVTHKMADDIRTSSERISELVGAVKNFTFMDKDSDRQLTDLHSGILNTLTMLNYKLKKGNIEVIDHYDASTPQVKVLPGEMNQVWTNIIDNAIDAMEINGNGNIEISSKYDNRFVKVYIKDNGPGIAKDIQDKIFTPFFTTKEIGKGTGLGLDVVHRIVIQHNGMVNVHSEAGNTEFEICLPL